MLTLIKKKNAEEFFTSERCHITELLNDASSPDLSMARCRVEPGVTTQLHSLNATGETYYIERGFGIIDDGKSNGGKSNAIEVFAGDSVRIPPDHPQRIRNTGMSDLVFLVLCRPRFEPGCYVCLEPED